MARSCGIVFGLVLCLATIATAQNKRMVEKHKEKLAAIEASRIKQFQKLADAVSKYSATIEAHATADNHLYGSVVARDISEALKTAGHQVEAEHVRLDGPIKELGMYTFVRWGYIFIAPPLCVTKEQIDEGLAIIGEALKIADENLI